MTDSSILEKITRNQTIPPAAEQEGEADDLGSFGWVRGNRERSLMLELRKKTGNVVAISYAMLHKIEFDPSAGITLWFPGQKIVLHGQQLNAEQRPNVRLFEGLTRHKVPWIQEVSQLSQFETTKGITIVERIDW